jgi:hypothetical protein
VLLYKKLLAAYKPGRIDPMPTNFNDIAKRALLQGHVDEPRASDMEELEVKHMTDLHEKLSDICVDTTDLTAATILTVIATFLGEAIVNHTDSAKEAVILFKDVTAILADSVYLCLSKKKETE